MHPPLHKPTNETACGEVIKNLEICHTKFKQFFGGCNQMKYDLNYCLRAEREARSAHNREEALARRERVKIKMAETMAEFEK
ncbi:hypothetical protein BDY24DRAFT_414461 [Mrakia frigida]|uniref:Cmc2p n=1 Tax=Mrakia frigida TaxID=29902 RepID=UPI003FCBF9CC